MTFNDVGQPHVAVLIDYITFCPHSFIQKTETPEKGDLLKDTASVRNVNTSFVLMGSTKTFPKETHLPFFSFSSKDLSRNSCKRSTCGHVAH